MSRTLQGERHVAARRSLPADAGAAGFTEGSFAQTQTPRLIAPPGTCDCHVHVLDPVRFPFQPKRRYTPGPAMLAQLQTMHDELGIGRVVVVQNSVYGTDNSCLVDTLTQLGPVSRGVAAIGPSTTSQDIASLDRSGVRGVRINLAVSNINDPTMALQALAVEERIPSTWHVHINAELSALAAVAGRLGQMRSQPIVDHFAHATAAKGVNQPGLPDIIALMRAKKVVVKISAPYQISQMPKYEDVLVIARYFVEAAPDQVIWGSDWPHTGGTNRPADQSLDVIEPFRDEDDNYDFNLLGQWVPDVAIRHLMLVDTPARLYGYPST